MTSMILEYDNNDNCLSQLTNNLVNRETIYYHHHPPTSTFEKGGTLSFGRSVYQAMSAQYLLTPLLKSYQT